MSLGRGKNPEYVEDLEEPSFFHLNHFRGPMGEKYAVFTGNKVKISVRNKKLFCDAEVSRSHLICPQFGNHCYRVSHTGFNLIPLFFG